MPLDPQMKALLDAMVAAEVPAFHTMTPIEARKMTSRRVVQGPNAVQVAQVVDRTIPGPGGEIPVRIYTPEGKGPFGALIYFHGGGWVVGDINMTDQPCRMLTNAAGCVTVSVDYRLAPEHKFPAAPEDCYTATKWVADNASALGVDPKRIAVGGTSAGGNLAAAVALMARDRANLPLAYQLLVYPATTSVLDTPSHREFAKDSYYILSRADMDWFWGHYLADAEDHTNPYACPAYARTLRGLPPAFVITAEFDPLRDEGEAYAARLREEGVTVALKRYDGVTHGFFGMPTVLDISKQAIADASAALRAALGG
ncbi:MAG TPA: alpha/beta hydrolase [Candidatus Binataceae bacterium]|nr:alpha/beta hydrolase [Candidatus Binataceae bacterium]